MGTAVYQMIADTLATEIRNGYFRPDDKIYSCAQLCAKFKVSPMTAVRVHSLLQDKGLVRKVHGQGVFVNAPGPRGDRVYSAAPLRKIVLSKFEEFETDELLREICRGVEDAARELGVDTRVEHINSKSISRQVLMNVPAIAPDEGHVVVSIGDKSHLASALILLDSHIRSVLVDNFIPGSHCVMTDNFDGIRQIMDYLEEEGKKKPLFAANYFSVTGTLNAHERLEAFKNIAQLKGLDADVIASGDFNELLARAQGADAPDAIIFPQDEPALKLKRILLDAGAKNPPTIIGFDDIHPDENDRLAIASLRVNWRGLGEAAARLLHENTRETCKKTIVRMPGKLIVRK